MKARLGDIRRAIREEYLRGVPEFVLRQATEKYVEEVRQHIMKFILTSKSDTGIDQRAAMAAANEVLEELNEEAFNLLEEKLWAFLRKV